MILLIDHADSFVYNLARYTTELGFASEVRRHDQLTCEQVEAMSPSHIILSPGPCTPDQARTSIACVQAFAGKIPMLGICLGHQIMAQAYGGRIVRARHPMHGRASVIRHAGGSLFSGMPSPFDAARYHSLVVERETLPDCFEVLAWSDEGEIMAMQHKTYKQQPLIGLQFHPESVLTPTGKDLLGKALSCMG